MNKLKTVLLTTALSASVSAALAADQTITDLNNSALAIQNQIDKAYQITSGITYYATVGGVAANGTVSDAYISTALMDNYNDALLAVQQTAYTDGAQFFRDEADKAFLNLGNAIDVFADAATQLDKVTTIGTMAAEAETTQEAVAMQTYINTNDVSIEQGDIEAYNTSLDNVEHYAQQAAAFTAAAKDETMTSIADGAANDFNQSLASANAYYNSTQDIITIAFLDGSGYEYNGFMDQYTKTTEEIMGMGVSIYEDDADGLKSLIQRR
jgi:hypothetical protein